MTVGNPVRLIIQFMIPMFLGNVFQQFYNIVDSFVAGQCPYYCTGRRQTVP